MSNIITLGRQFGSGGREIGKRLADALGYTYYDKEIIGLIAEKSGLSEEFIASRDEERIIANYSITMGRTFIAPMVNFSDNVFIEQTKILKEIAQKGNCIIVGRCADYILREQDPFKIFIMGSDMKKKIDRCYEKEPADKDKSQKEIEKKINEIDKSRAKYYDYYTDRKWGALSNYNIALDSSRIPIKTAVEVIKMAYEKR